jgi:hypothetical protein
MTLANCWETAAGLPPEIVRIIEPLGTPELLIALPEHKVPLPGAKRGDSQSDIFALVRAGEKTIAMTIEGKVDEPFDKLVCEWLVKASEGKRQRLTYIRELLGLSEDGIDGVYYQLLHRAAAAVIEARRFKTDVACMIVHSFSPTKRWFDAFAAFVELFGQRAEPNKLIPLRPSGTPPLYTGWATGDERFLAETVRPTLDTP